MSAIAAEEGPEVTAVTADDEGGQILARERFPGSSKFALGLVVVLYGSASVLTVNPCDYLKVPVRTVCTIAAGKRDSLQRPGWRSPEGRPAPAPLCCGVDGAL